jgi:predicted Zn finger-like uncharacterized protein
MPIHAVCPDCRHRYTLMDSQAGKKVRCSECRAVFVAKEAPGRRGEDEPDEVEPEVEVVRPRSRPAITATPPRRGAAVSDGRDEEDEEERGPAPPPSREKAAAPASSNVPWIVGGAVACCALLVAGVIGGLLLSRSKPAETARANDEPPPAQQQPVQPVVVPVVPTQKGDERPAETRPPRKGELAPEARDKVKQATVLLRVQMADGSRAEGSGFFGAPDAPNIVLTNAHVIGMLDPNSRRPRAIEVYVHSGQPNEQRTTARVLGVDRASDLAVLDLGTPVFALPSPLNVKSAAEVRELDKVFVFGFPLGTGLGKEITIRDSSISSLRKKGGALDRIQVNGGMDPGNSGGPVVDDNGDVIGVAVSGIPGRMINFAIPGERVHAILNGRIAEMGMGQPYHVAGGRVAVPCTMVMIDPRNRIREVGLEVWTGQEPSPKEPYRPAASTAPPALPGDSERARVKLAYEAGEGKADVVLPELPVGKAYWVQPYWVHGTGETRWASANTYRLAMPPVERKPATLVLKHQAGPPRTVRLTITNSFRVGNDAEAEVARMDTRAALSETLQGTNPAGATYRLTYAGVDQTMVVNKRPIPNPDLPKARAHLKQLVTILDFDSAGNLRRNTLHLLTPRGLVNEAQLKSSPLGRSLLDFQDPIKAGLDAMAVPVPGRAVNPLEGWGAERLFPVEVPGAPVRKVSLRLSYTYLGQRKRGGRDEAVVAIAGAIRDARVGGRASGTAVIDLATGRILLAEVRVSVDMQLRARMPGGKEEQFKAVDSLLVRLERNL